jgi:hypothetical protein
MVAATIMRAHAMPEYIAWAEIRNERLINGSNLKKELTGAAVVTSSTVRSSVRLE